MGKTDNKSDAKNTKHSMKLRSHISKIDKKTTKKQGGGNGDGGDSDNDKESQHDHEHLELQEEYYEEEWMDDGEDEDDDGDDEDEDDDGEDEGEDEDGEDEDGEDEDDEEEDDDDGEYHPANNQPVVLVITSGAARGAASGAGAAAMIAANKKAMKRKHKATCECEDDEIADSFSPAEQKYWDNLNEIERDRIYAEIKRVKDSNTSGIIPMKFKLLDTDMDMATKNLLLAKIEQFNNMNEGSGEYFKLRNWLEGVSRIPFGKINPLPINSNDSLEKCSQFLIDTRKRLDDTVFGHFEAKDQIMRIMAQWISNPQSQGHCIGIHGSAGIGKTTMVKDGICKALNLPFGFIALGGATDGSFLDGHSFTYEGSMYGKIAEVLMKCQCMNPVLFFDELDKVSTTHRGDEIIGILTHLTDSSQNEKYNDRYFGEIDLDLSKSLIIFSYNDESRINPILKDRMITIHVKGYNTPEKLTIAKDYLLPQILKEFNIKNTDIIFDDKIINMIISRVKEEEGVRNLKRGIYSIISWVNMLRYTEPDKVSFPFTVLDDHVHKCIKNSNDLSSNISVNMMYI